MQWFLMLFIGSSRMNHIAYAHDLSRPHDIGYIYIYIYM